MEVEAASTTAAAERVLCPCCGGRRGASFFSLPGVPVHDVQLISSREEARNCLRGDILLRVCGDCGFIWNAAFDPARLDYSIDYESTQAFSPTFNRFHERLATDLIERFDLRGKTIIEIGCGQGEFLEMLCEIGGNRGLGFDPAYRGVPERERMTMVSDYYSERYADATADFVACKMTLEHIHDPHQFVGTVRRAVGDDETITVFFQVPDVARILSERAFWDIYYEHCSYFSAGSLAGVFRASGFDVFDVWRDYDDQYLMLAARPGNGGGARLPTEEAPADMTDATRSFGDKAKQDQARWRGWLNERREKDDRVVLWGGGSKAVAFLAGLGVQDEVRYAVDINPRKHGKFLAGSGQEVVGPAFLPEYRPDAVIVMNAIYRDEIASALREMSMSPTLVTASAVREGAIEVRDG